MQHKQTISSPANVVKLGVVLVAVAVVLVLMTAHIPAPVHPIEKTLDASAFLNHKP